MNDEKIAWVLFGFACFILSLGCVSSTISPKAGSEKVDIISKQQVGGDWGEGCERIGEVTARVGPNPEAEGSSYSPAEIEARNKAFERGATHVAVGTSRSFPCNSTGSHCGSCGYTCHEIPAVAYKCGDESLTADSDSD